MTDKKKLVNAENIYKILCGFFDEKKWVYNKLEDKLRVSITMHYNSLPIEMVLEIDAERDLINLYCKLSVVFQGEKRIDGALATGEINYRLYDGNFDYNFESGEVYFRLTASFKDSVVTKYLVDYMMNCACKTVFDYEEKLSSLAEGKMSLEAFNKAISQKK